jgi:DnaJ-class molecular chaperone
MTYLTFCRVISAVVSAVGCGTCGGGGKLGANNRTCPTCNGSGKSALESRGR